MAILDFFRPRKIVCALSLAALTLGLTTIVSADGLEGLSAKRPFSIQQHDDQSWLIKPNGERFFSFGVCCVNQGIPRSELDAANPGYAAWQHYTDSNQWAEATLKRLKSWGFTTIGGWSDFECLRSSTNAQMFFAPVLNIGATAGAPWWDMWDPKITDRMDQVARDQILPLRDDPRVIGYYSDNEIGWWNAILFRMTLEQRSTSGQRQRLIELLRKTYHNEWPELMRNFDAAPGVDSWSDLEQHGLLFLRPGSEGIRVYRQFLGLLAERYYTLVHDIIRKYDQRALILGDRYQSFYYPEVARACAPHVDAVSCNLNAAWNDGRFARFYLDTLYQLTHKPVLIGEFYMSAKENRSGNKNNHGVYPVVSTQKERAAGFRNTLQSLLAAPYVIGADWFQYYDQPTHGRYDGEDFNFGLVNIHDRPYEPLVESISALDPVRLKTEAPTVRLDASQGIPPAPRDPMAHFEPTLALKHWNREAGFVKPLSEFPLADLYVCWNEKAVYLGLYAQDVVEDVFYRDKVVRASDRAAWTISIASTQSIRARIGAGLEPVVDVPAVQLVNISGINGNFRNVACMELPAKLFGKDRFRKGDTVEFASTLFTHCRAYRSEWKGTFTLRGK